MDSTYQNLQSSCLLGRPKSVIQFSIRYLNDEKLTFQFPSSFNYTMASSVYLQVIEEYHAIHLLPFLITQPDEFRNIACIIFSAEQMNGHFSKDLHQYATNTGSSKPLTLGSNSVDNLKDLSKQNNTVTNNYREFLDGNTLLDIIQAMDLPSYGLQMNYLDEVCVSFIFPSLFLFN
jgi:hypothetical protein